MATPAPYEIPGFSFTLVSSADFTGSQYRFVMVDSNGQAALPTLGGRAIGVRTNKPNVNEATTIVNTGIVLVEASAAISAGAKVSCTATGQAVTTATTNFSHGTALTACSNAGEFIAVLLNIAPDSTAP